MSEAETDTHPVYIGHDLKKKVKLIATEDEITMREVTERLIERGVDEDFHKTPLPAEFISDLDDIEDDVSVARTEDDLDRASDRVDDVEADLEGVDFPESNGHEVVEERIHEVRNQIETVRQELTGGN
jgi:hypothetical protein